MNPSPPPLRTQAVTVAAMTAFAANSILCRLALGPPDIDAVSFTAARLVSGAVTLLFLSRLAGRTAQEKSRGDWISGGALFVYAIMFSLAYRRLEVGAGALILFALVQVTMVGWGLVRGERPRPIQWIGLAAAFGGLVYLVSPGLAAPPVSGSIMMAAAGAAWGVYSIRGRAAVDPVAATTGNFVRSVPMVMIVAVPFYSVVDLSARGLWLAIASGSLASGLGYVIWYYALGGLSSTRAASVQLSVPVIAAAGGLVFLGESFSLQLSISAVLILGGIGLTQLGGKSAGGSDE
jgi:drug/metabolite transporter (DMT)-like permease